ncbi:LacI family DNA-binding transcriptional regulator [Falsarthrobacter nasiphocae]
MTTRGTPYAITMSDVAALARVSRATVSRVLAGHDVVSGSTRERVLHAVETLGYVPNANAQSLAQPRANAVGVLLRDPRNPVYGLLHASLQEAAPALGLEVVAATVSQQGGVEAEREGIQRLRRHRVSGILIASGSAPSSLVAETAATLPTVAVGRVETDPTLTAVSYDERANCELIADAVVAAGHRRVGVFRVPVRFSYMENLRGELLASGLRARGVEVMDVDDAPDPAGSGAAGEGMGRLIDMARRGEVTCLCFPTDLRMLAFMDAAGKAGVRVPEDVSVTGIDGIMQGRDYLGLTTVRLPVEDVARRALEVFAEQVARGPGVAVGSELLPGKLVRGRTLGAPPMGPG